MNSSFHWMNLVVALLIVAVPLLGVIMLTLGIRGRARFSSPTCTKCSYDLRAANFMAGAPGACPECGTDLAIAKAVSFGRYERSRKKIIGGIGLLLLPVLLYFVWMTVMVRTTRISTFGPSAMPSLLTAQILSALPATADQPWSWRELNNRLKAGRLSSAEIDSALAALVQSIKAGRANNPSPHPLSWSNDFVKDAIASGKVNPQRIQELCEAFFADAIRIETPKVVRLGQPIRISINGTTSWDMAGKVMVWSPREAKTGRGPSLGLREPGSAKNVTLPSEEFSQKSYGNLSLELRELTEPGDQELVFVFDAGAVDQNTTLRGKDGKPGLKEMWPSPLATWQITLRQKIRVVPADQLAVQLDTDPSHDPQRTKASLVKEAIVRKATDGVEVVVSWDWANAPCPPMAGKVTATVDGREVDMRSLEWGHLSGENGNNQGWGGERCQSTARIAGLPPQAKSISIRVVPDPAAAEKMLGLDTIWGKPVEIKDIPLQRFDLDPEAGRSPVSCEFPEFFNNIVLHRPVDRMSALT